MVSAKDTAADLLLFLQDKAKLMPDYSNMFVMAKKLENGDWEEIDEDEEPAISAVKPIG